MVKGLRAGRVTVNLDSAPIVYVKTHYAKSGPHQHLLRQTRQVARRAQELAPFRTGRLRTSIHVGQNRDRRGRFAFGFTVYSDAPYGGYVHEGTDPSVRYGDMFFEGTNGHGRYWMNGFVYTPIVNHPGTPANPFLAKALPALRK